MNRVLFKLRENIDLARFCTNWKEFEDRYILHSSAGDDFIIIEKESRIVEFKGYESTNHYWLIEGIIYITQT